MKIKKHTSQLRIILFISRCWLVWQKSSFMGFNFCIRSQHLLV